MAPRPDSYEAAFHAVGVGNFTLDLRGRNEATVVLLISIMLSRRPRQATVWPPPPNGPATQNISG
jgi:hypothetical protein